MIYGPMIAKYALMIFLHFGTVGYHVDYSLGPMSSEWQGCGAESMAVYFDMQPEPFFIRWGASGLCWQEPVQRSKREGSEK